MNADFLKSIGFEMLGGFEKIQKGGSARAFFRFSDKNLGSLIFCEYSGEKEENFLYADIAEFLSRNGVSVPKIHFHDKHKRMLVMQDVGKTDLLDFCKTAEKSEMSKFYKKALLNAAILHEEATKAHLKNPVKIMAGFDESLYEWERNYFFENLIENRLKLNLEKPLEEWKKISPILKEQTLIHRDLQSQNVIVNGENVFLIDFQGMRLGSFWYDLGSLLFDPYCENLTSELREELANFYCETRKIAFDKNAFYAASSQRLMQALGAYAYLSGVKNKPEYLNYITPALKNLKICAKNANLFKTLEIAEIAQKKLEETK